MNRRQWMNIIQKIKRKTRVGNSLNFRRKRWRIQRGQVKFYGVLVAEICGVILAAFLLTQAFGMRVVCAGASMKDAIPENVSVWVNRLAYSFSEPQKEDVIVFLPKGNTNASYSIKRVVAVPGDTVLISNGKLYVNEKLVTLDKEKTAITEAGRATNPILLEEDEYFVLGDNINNSEDSRYETIGNVNKGEIYGKAWCIASLSDFGLIQ